MPSRRAASLLLPPVSRSMRAAAARVSVARSTGNGRPSPAVARSAAGWSSSRSSEPGGDKHQRALDRVAKLAHVAGPRVPSQHRPHFRGERRHRKPVARRQTGQEGLGQKLRVSFALAQRRQHERHHVQPVVQILAELAAAHSRGEVHVRRRDHADIHLARGLTADASDLPGPRAREAAWAGARAADCRPRPAAACRRGPSRRGPASSRWHR